MSFNPDHQAPAPAAEDIFSTPPCNPDFREDKEEDYAIAPSEDSSTQPQQPTERTKRQVGGAAVAAGIAGLAVSGPILGVAAAGGAAYAATTNSGVPGSVARQTGESVASVGDKCKEIDQKHNIMKRSTQMVKTAAKKTREFDEKHKITSTSIETSKKIGTSAWEGAKKIDEKHHVVDNTKLAAKKAIEKAKHVNQKHHVTEKTAKAASFTSKKVLAGAKFVSSKMMTKETKFATSSTAAEHQKH
ncbi:hypothetical protein ACHAXM_000786 [Skeletonema potamos]